MGRHIIEGDTAAGDLAGTFPSPAVNVTAVLDRLPRYSSLALALSGGVASGGYFVLTGIALGLDTVGVVVRAP